VNKLLSYLRANTVRKSLLKNGVKSSQIKSVSGRGASNFVVNCVTNSPCDENAHQQNRRVVFVVSK
jgi:outer membrane protein OmpA-like peptidoglycan-associated protein